MKTKSLMIRKDENCPGFKTNLKKSKKKSAAAKVAAKREANLQRPKDFLILVIWSLSTFNENMIDVKTAIAIKITVKIGTTFLKSMLTVLSL